MISKDELNQLGDIINYTWGKSSGDGTRSLTCALDNDELQIKFQTVVHFASEQSLRQQVDRLVEESTQIIAAKVTVTKQRYKEVAGVALKLEETSNMDDIEMISMSVYNPRRIAIYRRNCSLRVQ
jgi:replicative DNA helicase